MGVGVPGIETDGGEVRVARASDLVAAEVEVAEVAVGGREIRVERERGLELALGVVVPAEGLSAKARPFRAATWRGCSARARS